MEEKRNLRTATLLTLGTILLIFLAIVMGVPALVRLAVFVGDLKSSSRPVDKNDLIPPGPPLILTQYDATNSAVQVVSGTAEPGSVVYLTQNSKSLGSVVAKEDGEWQVGEVRLEEGENTFLAVTVDQAGNRSNQSREATMWYMTKNPSLSLDDPVDRKVVSGSDARVVIKGKTDGGVRLTVNERVIIVDSQGSFSSFYNLNPGENSMVFVATDRAGNQTRKEVLVTYNP